MSSTESESEYRLLAKEWHDYSHVCAYVYIRYHNDKDKDYYIGCVHNVADPDFASFFPTKDADLDLTELESLVKYMRTGEADIKENK